MTEESLLLFTTKTRAKNYRDVNRLTAFFRSSVTGVFFILSGITLAAWCQTLKKAADPLRERISINEGWKFMLYPAEPDKLRYYERPKVTSHNDNIVADTRPVDSVLAGASASMIDTKNFNKILSYL